ncbi:putative mediator of RNA polymerase II transcription subunit 12 [Ostrinia nubilalis]|uniref:putative mediator of RNA polymerase II transcription subunit 12 n=1 Tax=Ostrinia nubilalis TaxID=29057 RepID=UPI0030823BC8
MKLLLILALALCAYAADVKEKEDKAEPTQNKDKRQTQDELVQGLVYRSPRKQEQVAPVEENQEEDKNRSDEEYRPGQVFSLNAQELLELQPERKAPLSSDQLLQQIYSPQEHKQNLQQNLQQLYYLEPQPQVGRQVSLQPSHAVIARPHYSSNGGEASVGAALSVSDTGASPQPYDQELLALLQVRPEEPRQHQQTYSQPQPIQQTSAPNLASQQHQQIDRYLTKPTKKTTKLRNKAQITPPQSPTAPQQYLIETTNVQQQQAQPSHQQIQQQYRPAPQQQRPVQSLRYVPIQQQQTQQVLYERPEPQGLKVIPAPKLQQQPRPQIAYRIVPQYQQPEATPKQYRLIEAPRQQPAKQEQRAYTAERPVTYLKRYPEPEKMRAVKIYEQVDLPSPPQPAQILGEQYYLRPVYRQQPEQRARFDVPVPLRQVEQRPIEATKAPSSAIYVSKNVAPKKLRPQPVRQEQNVKIEQPSREQYSRVEQSAHYEPVSIEQHGQSIEEQRAQLPPPRNNKAYTPEEFAALVAAGYSVTPVPVSALNSHGAQSRSLLEPVPTQLTKRRPLYRRPQYLPIRDDAP